MNIGQIHAFGKPISDFYSDSNNNHTAHSNVAEHWPTTGIKK